MKASDLITLISLNMEQYGDLEIKYTGEHLGEWWNIEEVVAETCDNEDFFVIQ